VHSLEPPWLNVPAGQATHSVERAVALYIPAGQGTHALLISCRPAAQSEHAPEVPEIAPEAHGGLCWADAAGAMSTTAATTHLGIPRDCLAADEAIAKDAMPVGGKQRRARLIVSLARCAVLLGGVESKRRKEEVARRDEY
jgi:hypothetical protein